MTPQNLAIVAGDSTTVQFTVSNASGGILDLTGAQAVRWVMSAVPAPPAILSKALGSGITITNATGGVVQVALLSADTNTLSGTYYHELQIEDVNSNWSTVAQGIIAIAPHTLR